MTISDSDLLHGFEKNPEKCFCGMSVQNSNLQQFYLDDQHLPQGT